MTVTELMKLVEGLIVVAGLFAVFYAVFKNSTVKATISGQRDLIETLQAQVKELRGLHSENEKAIAKLTGQVEVYKELPLSQLAVSMAEVVEAQKEILTILKKKVK